MKWQIFMNLTILSPPARVVWIEMVIFIMLVVMVLWSPPARVVWIEISGVLVSIPTAWVATREGGVD